MIYILFLSIIIILALLFRISNINRDENNLNVISFYIIYYFFTSIMVLSRGLQEKFFGAVDTNSLIYLTLVIISTIPGLLIVFSRSKISTDHKEFNLYYEIDGKIIKYMVISSIIFCILLFIYNVFFFSSGDILDYFHSADIIRRKRFEFNFTGAPMVYSLLEYLGYTYIGLISICFFYIRERKVLIRHIFLLLVAAIIFSVTYSSRTPLVIFFTLVLTSLLFTSDLLKRILRFINFKNILIFLLMWLAFNSIALNRDSSSILMANAIENYSGIKVSRDIFTLSFLSNTLYLSTSLNNLSDIINQNSTQEYSFGLKSFGSLFSFVRKFGVDFNVFDEAFSAAGITNQSVFGNDVVYNSTTTYDSFIQDFGEYGSLCFLCFFFIISSIVIYNAKRSIAIFYFGSILILWAVNASFLNVFSSWGKAIFSGFLVVIFFNFTQGFSRRKNGKHRV